MFAKFIIKSIVIVSISLLFIEADDIRVYSSDSFVESIGVNTHWASHNVYWNNYTDVKSKLAESGIRYIRDGTFNEVFVRVNDLYESLEGENNNDNRTMENWFNATTIKSITHR